MLQLYHIGGLNNAGSVVSNVYVYDEASQQWQSAESLPQALFDHRCTVLNCQGLVCGGFTANRVLYFLFLLAPRILAEPVEAVLLVRWPHVDCQVSFTYLS